jgi:hypothetical protein
MKNLRALNPDELYGVLIPCGKGCEHLAAADKDYFQAWSKAFPFGGLDDARTIIVKENEPTVLALIEKK